MFAAHLGNNSIASRNYMLIVNVILLFSPMKVYQDVVRQSHRKKANVQSIIFTLHSMFIYNFT